MKPVGQGAGSRRGFPRRVAVRVGALTTVGGGGTAGPLRARSDRLPWVSAAEGGQACQMDDGDRSIYRALDGAHESILPVEVTLIYPQHICVSGGIMHLAAGLGRTVAVL